MLPILHSVDSLECGYNLYKGLVQNNSSCILIIIFYSEFKSDEVHAAFAFYGLDGVINTLAFNKIDDELKQEIGQYPYDFKTVGKQIILLQMQKNTGKTWCVL